MSFEIRNESLTDKDDFGGVKLSDLVVIDSTAYETLFEEGQYPNIHWENTHSSKVSFKGSKLSGWFKSSTFLDSNFDQTELSNLKMYDCTHNRSKLSNIESSEMVLNNTTLHNSHIIDSEIKGIEVYNSKFENITCISSEMNDGYFTDLFAVRFYLSLTKVIDTNLIFKNSDDVNFVKCEVSDGSYISGLGLNWFISNTEFSNTALMDLELHYPKVENTSFIMCNWKRCEVTDGHFSGSNISQTTWFKTKIESNFINFTFDRLTTFDVQAKLNCQRVVFKDCTFRGVDFRGSRFSLVTFENCTFDTSCKLQGVDLRGATLIKTNVPDSIK